MDVYGEGESPLEDEMLFINEVLLYFIDSNEHIYIILCYIKYNRRFVG